MSTQTLEPAAPAQTDLHVAVDAGELPPSSELSRFRAAMKEGAVPDLSAPALKVEPVPVTEPPKSEPAPVPAATAKAEPELDPTTGKPYSGRQQYINDLIRAQTRAEMRVEQLERDLEVLRQGSTRAAPAESQFTRPKPQESDVGTKYATYGELVEDVARWTFEQFEAARMSAAQSQHDSRRASETMAAHRGRMVEAQRIFPDIQEALTAITAHVRGNDYEPLIASAIAESEVGPQVIRRLWTHPEDLRALLAAKDARAVDRVFGRLEAQLQAPAQASPAPTAQPKTSELPPPLPKTVGAGAATGTLDISKVNDLRTFRTVIKPKFGMS